jgi:hypothetical protein
VVRRKFILWLACLAVTLFGIALWVGQIRGHGFSDPHAVRTNAAYARIMAPSTPAPLVPSNLWANVAVVKTNNGMDITFSPSPSLWDTFYDLELIRASPMDRLKLGEGALQLALIGVAYPEKPITTNFEYEAKLPGKWFHPNFTKAMESEVKEIVTDSSETEIGYAGPFPTGKFVFTRANVAEFKLMGTAVFNAQTHQDLTSGSSSSGDRHTTWFSSQISIWHEAPIEVVLTAAIGPAENFKLEPTEGANCHLPFGEIHLASIVEDRANSWGTSSSAPNGVHISVSPHEGESTFVLLCWPHANLPVDVEFYAVNGKKLEGGGSGTSGQMMLAGVRARPNEVGQLRIKYYPHIKRLIWRLPELPGLPEQNRNLKNLFDARIPYLRIAHEYQLNEALGHAVGMDVQSGFLPPATAMPITLTNASPSDLLEKLQSFAPPRTEIYVDSVNQKIETRPPLWMQVWLKIKQLAGAK